VQNDSYNESANRPGLSIRGTVETSSAEVSAVVNAPQTSYANSVTRDVRAASLPASGSPVFVLKTGTVLAVGNYQYQDGRLTYTLASGGEGA
jgi:hypothetical protein